MPVPLIKKPVVAPPPVSAEAPKTLLSKSNTLESLQIRFYSKALAWLEAWERKQEVPAKKNLTYDEALRLAHKEIAAGETTATTVVLKGSPAPAPKPVVKLKLGALNKKSLATAVSAEELQLYNRKQLKEYAIAQGIPESELDGRTAADIRDKLITK